MEINLSIPHNIEAEQAVLGSIIESNELMDDISSFLTPGCFFKTAHQLIFKAMVELSENNKPIDEVLLGDELQSLNRLEEVGGYAYLSELVEYAPVEGNIIYYAKIILEDAKLRELIEITTDIGIKARNPEQNPTLLIREAEQRISEIIFDDSTESIKHIKEALKNRFIQLEKLSENPNGLVGIPTGFIDLDKLTCGLIPQNLIIIAARPAMGKSALAFNIASYVATRGYPDKPVLIFSAEMSKEQTADRLLSGEGRISASKIKTGNLEQDDWDKLAMATDKISGSPIFIDDETYGFDKIVHKTKRFHKKNGISVLFIDYLQLLEGSKKQSREQEISDMSRKSKLLAKLLDIPVVLLAQLNRTCETRPDKRPRLSDLRESGAIEQDADIVMFIYRDEVYDTDSADKGIAEIIIRKHRSGPVGTVRLAYVGKYVKFSNLSQMTPDTVYNPEHWQK
jgi:replicative DNA helicase